MLSTNVAVGHSKAYSASPETTLPIKGNVTLSNLLARVG